MRNESRIDERNKNYEAVIKQRRVFAIFIFFSTLLISVGTVDVLLNGEGDYGDYLWFNPFDTANNAKNRYYYENYMYIPVTTSIVSLMIWLFHFGNPKRWYIKKLEKAKQTIIKFVPFYFDGYDERNLYIRFGFKFSLMNNFLKRKVHQKNYLKKVSYLGIFIEDLSPHKIFEVQVSAGTKKKPPKMINLKINKKFTNENMFFELFKIIEGYLVSNVDIIKNIPLKDYRAIGTEKAIFTKESAKYFVKQNIEEKKEKKALKDFEQLFDKKNQKKIKEEDFKKEFKKIIKKYAGSKGLLYYRNNIKKMVVFSPVAIKEMMDRVYIDSKRYYSQIKLFRSKTYEKIMEYGEINEEKMLSLISFVYFYKIINLFMGLPSGIITARLKDYDMKRILDDIDHFEASRGIRQIKAGENDRRGKYNDIFARGFMIFYHEYTNNSFNKNLLSSIFNNFDPLRNIGNEDASHFSFDGFGNFTSNKEGEFISGDSYTFEETKG